MITYLRHRVPGMADNDSAGNFEKAMLQELIEFIKNRFNNQFINHSFFAERIDHLAQKWLALKLSGQNSLKYKEILRRSNEKDTRKDNRDWVLMSSMREIDSSTYIQIKENFKE
ncbi:MAG: hypothetical protein MUF15_04280 [Acidobacteria bacterium]|nr:hypothetical protein [Acidobacteriota bacterium]